MAVQRQSLKIQVGHGSRSHDLLRNEEMSSDTSLVICVNESKGFRAAEGVGS